MLGRLLLASLTAAALLGSAGSAGAAEVHLGPDPNDERVAPDPWFFVTGAPGETNNLTVRAAADGTSVTVADAGATLTSGAGCVAVDAHDARCTPPPGSYLGRIWAGVVSLGDGSDTAQLDVPAAPAADGSTWAFVRATGGTGDDAVTLTPGSASSRLDGGAGDDSLTGAGADDALRGGPGADRLRAGGGFDTLTGGPGSDLLDGGPGRDSSSWEDHRTGVRASLPKRLATGRSGERDRLRGIEDLFGGSGPDVLIGDRHPNRLQDGGGEKVADKLYGGGGDDTLESFGGADRLSGGAGNDGFDPVGGGAHLTCGAGTDSVGRPQDAPFVPNDCERVEAEAFAYGPIRVTHGRAHMDVRCDPRTFLPYPLSADTLDAPLPVTLRLASPAGRRFGSASFHRCGGLSIRLTPAGRRAAGRHATVVVTHRYYDSRYSWRRRLS